MNEDDLMRASDSTKPYNITKAQALSWILGDNPVAINTTSASRSHSHNLTDVASITTSTGGSTIGVDNSLRREIESLREEINKLKEAKKQVTQVDDKPEHRKII